MNTNQMATFVVVILLAGCISVFDEKQNAAIPVQKQSPNENVAVNPSTNQPTEQAHIAQKSAKTAGKIMTDLLAESCPETRIITEKRLPFYFDTPKNWYEEETPDGIALTKPYAEEKFYVESAQIFIKIPSGNTKTTLEEFDRLMTLAYEDNSGKNSQAPSIFADTIKRDRGQLERKHTFNVDGVGMNAYLVNKYGGIGGVGVGTGSENEYREYTKTVVFSFQEQLFQINLITYNIDEHEKPFDSFIQSIRFKSPVCVVQDQCASTCQYAKLSGMNLTNGPCLAHPPASNWACDIVHTPREPQDDVPENQCQDSKKSIQYLVELDENCRIISVIVNKEYNATN